MRQVGYDHAMNLDEAIHTRRTTKSFDLERQPDPAVIDELLELARWAPNHRLTEPWRFRVVGPESRAALMRAAGHGAAKVDRAPVLIVASMVPSPIPLHAREDELSAACATHNILLGATARGLASYWRTPGVLRDAAGLAAVNVPDTERILGLIYLGWPAPDKPLPQAPARAAIGDYVTYLP